MLASFLLALLPQAAPASGEPAFVSGLEEVRGLVDRERWGEAKSRLLGLVEEHREQGYVRARRREVIEELSRCALRLAVPRPDPRDCISGKLVKWSRSGGEIEVVYAADSMGDFTNAPNASLLGGLMPSIVVHPARFAGPCSLEIAGEQLPAQNGLTGSSIMILALLDDADPIRLVIGALDADGGKGPSWISSASRIESITNGRPLLLDSTDKSPIAGKRYRIKAVVTDTTVTLMCNGKTLLQGKKKAGAWGRFAVTAPADFDSLTLRGKATPAWLEGVVDAATKEKEKAFLASWDPRADLPEWLRAGDASDDGDGRELGPEFTPTPEQRKHLETARRFRESGFIGRAIDYLEELPPEALPPDARDWEIGLALIDLGDEQVFDRHLENVRIRDGKSRIAWLLQGKFLVDAGRFDEALEYLALVVKGLPEDAGVIALHALAQLHAGSLAAAQSTLRDARTAGVASTLLDQLDAAALAAERGPGFARRFEESTKHYRVVSDIDAPTCREAARVLEECHELYTRFFGAADAGGRLFDVSLFSGQSGYLEFSRMIGSPAPHVTGGLYQPLLKQILVWNLPDRDELFSTLRHEACHQYLDLLGYRAPRWFEEGMAEYATQFLRRGIASVHTGSIPPAELARMKEAVRRRVELSIFVGQTPRDFYSGGSRSYAQAWALVHFLRHGGKPVQGIYDRLVAALRDGLPHRELVKRAFEGVDLEQLDPAFERHVDGLR